MIYNIYKHVFRYNVYGCTYKQFIVHVLEGGRVRPPLLHFLREEGMGGLFSMGMTCFSGFFFKGWYVIAVLWFWIVGFQKVWHTPPRNECIYIRRGCSSIVLSFLDYIKVIRARASVIRSVTYSCIYYNDLSYC